MLTPTFRIGDSAKNAYHSNPENTVFDAKRLIGRKVNDPDLKDDIKHWPFKVSEKNGKPAISVKYKGEMRDFVRFFRSLLENLLPYHSCSLAIRPQRKSVPWF